MEFKGHTSTLGGVGRRQGVLAERVWLRETRIQGSKLEQDSRLRSRMQERGRREKQLLNIIIFLALALVGVCVYKFIEKEQVIMQLESSLTERKQQLQSSLAENAQLQSYSTEKKRIITRLQISVSEKEWIISQLWRSFPTAFCTCHISGPGLSATANYPTHVIVELSDASGQPCSLG